MECYFNRRGVNPKINCFFVAYAPPSMAGVSNSVSYAGHILTKEGLMGRIKRKNVSAGHNWMLKVPLYYKKT
jgi:hypothetical protein